MYVLGGKLPLTEKEHNGDKRSKGKEFLTSNRDDGANTNKTRVVENSTKP